MDASKLDRRNAAQNTVRFAMSMVVLIAALLTTTFAVPALERAQMAVSAANKDGWISDVRNYLRNPLDYFAQRSPGARQSGQLVQSKQRMAQLGHKGEKPHEQVLSNIRYPSAIPDFINDILPRPAVGPFEPNLVTPSVLPVPAVTPGTPPPIVPVTNTPSTPGGNPGSAVPEPSTWFMVIWGMGLVGVGLRSARRVKGAARMGFRARI